MTEQCPLCERFGAIMSLHHVIPKSQGGQHVELICSDCHNAIHANYSNKELAHTLYNLEALKADPILNKTYKFLKKQDPQRRFRNKRSNRKRRR